MRTSDSRDQEATGSFSGWRNAVVHLSCSSICYVYTPGFSTLVKKERGESWLRNDLTYGRSVPKCAPHTHTHTTIHLCIYRCLYMCIYSHIQLYASVCVYLWYSLINKLGTAIILVSNKQDSFNSSVIKVAWVYLTELSLSCDSLIRYV